MAKILMVHKLCRFQKMNTAAISYVYIKTGSTSS